MEKDANYALVGLSTLILFVGLVVFVVWLAFKKTPYAVRGLLLSLFLAAAMLVLYPPAQTRFASPSGTYCEPRNDRCSIRCAKPRSESFSISEEDHPKFKAAMHEAALAAVADGAKSS